jgi:hypothetical protein
LALLILAALPKAHANDLKVPKNHLSANAVIDSRSDVLVRFDSAADQANSKILVKRGSETLQTLEPRLDTEMNALCARAPTLPSGRYTLRWIVKTMQNAKIEQGQIPFSIGVPK